MKTSAQPDRPTTVSKKHALDAAEAMRGLGAPDWGGAQEAARKLGILPKPDVDHYTGTIEPIDYMQATMTHEEFRGYLRGNVIKYTSRFHRKGGMDDLRKARVYLDWLIQHENDAPAD